MDRLSRHGQQQPNNLSATASNQTSILDQGPLSVPIVPPLVASTLHSFRKTDDLIAFKDLEVRRKTGPLIEYSRYGNPLEILVEQKLADLDNARAAVLFPSGMSAITATLLGLHRHLVPGSEIICSDETYRQTRNFCDTQLSRMGIVVKRVATEDFKQLETILTDKTAVVFIETPSNPYLRVLDIERIAACKEKNPFILVVDSTFASPFNQQPITLGADLVIHSVSKYLAGHNDLLSGVVSGDANLIQEIREHRGMNGQNLAPELAFRIHQYLHDFPLRMARHNENGLAIARALEKHPCVERVWYPGLESHPDYEIACRQLSGFGSVVTFTTIGDLRLTARFIDNCQFAKNGPSFGSPVTVIEQPAYMSHYQLTTPQRLAIDCRDNLTRLAVGLGDPQKDIDGLYEALEVIRRPERPSKFEASAYFFPIKYNFDYLNNCGVGAVYGPSAVAVQKTANAIVLSGSEAVTPVLVEFKTEAAKLLGTEASNISSIQNCAQGLTMIARGLKLAPGDEIIGYASEYPSNHYLWKELEKEGVVCKQMAGETWKGKPLRWTMQELESLVTDKTRVIALSHVQFTSGFRCDLQELGSFCRERNIRLIVDAAQSLGCIPVLPDEWGIDAVVASGWKWLMGPHGTGVLYTSQAFRNELGHVFVGPDMMQQGDDFLDQTFNPFEDGRRFEFSTQPKVAIAGLTTAIRDGANTFGVENLWSAIQESQAALVAELPPEIFQAVPLRPDEQAGILSFHSTINPQELKAQLQKEGIIISERGGYVRFAPHYWNTPQETAAIGRRICKILRAVN